MNYQQFQSLIEQARTGHQIQTQSTCFGHLIQETVDGNILVDRQQAEYSSVEEAVQQIRQHRIQQDIQAKIQQDLYEEMSDNKVADIINTHHSDIKVTDTLIESYVELASSKSFTVNPVVKDIRKFNILDRLVENKIDYKLDDGTVVCILESTHDKINNTFGKHTDVISYMRDSVENFLSVVNQLED